MSSLIQCPACGNNVSSSANSCPNCGHKISSSLTEKAIKLLVWGAVIYFVINAFAFGSLFINGSSVKFFLIGFFGVIVISIVVAAIFGFLQGFFSSRKNKPKSIEDSSLVMATEEKTEFEKRHNL